MKTSEVRLPNDVSRCNNFECPLKMNCKRYLAWGHDIRFDRILVSDFKPLSETHCHNQLKLTI